MYCRCTDCHATYPVIAAQLAAAGGRVRCQRCSKAFNALDSLFDQWPESGEQPPGHDRAQAPSESGTNAVLPLLGQAQLQPQRPDSDTDDLIGAPVTHDASPPGAASWLLWSTAATALLGVLLLQLYQDPQARDWAGLSSSPYKPGQVNTPVQKVQLYSRDLHEHPGVEDALVLSAVLRNPEAIAQPYPVLEVSLTNQNNDIIAQRRFQPDEYLDSPDQGNGSFPAEALLPLLLEFTDPGPEATGYQLEFY